MRPPPPSSTLFPYTTLFRSQATADRSSDRITDDPSSQKDRRGDDACGDELALDSQGAKSNMAPRSEEHTSELQSRRDLVCRLLLEKKKQRSGPSARACVTSL